MRLEFSAAALLLTFGSPVPSRAAVPSYAIDEGVALAQAQNPEIAIARKKVQGARGGWIEARSGYLPSLSSSGLYDKRQQQSETRLREEDYNARLQIEQNLYTGGAVTSQVAIAYLNIDKANYDLQEIVSRVTLDVRIAFNELLLNRAKVRVREDSVRVLDEDLKSQQQSFSAGIVGKLNVQRAEVALANEQPELFNAQTQLRNSYLRLSELFGIDSPTAFSGYEVYSERDPEVGQEFNYGYVVGINATWNIFDGFATKGRMQATHARREAAVQALAAARRSVASEVRGAFFDLEQAERVLEAETRNVQTADEALEITKGNFAAGLGTQLDILQAASDVTRTRTTRLSAIYLHNVALARLAHACDSPAEALDFGSKIKNARHENHSAAQAADLARPPEKLSQR